MWGSTVMFPALLLTLNKYSSWRVGGGLYQWFAQQSGLPSVVFWGQIWYLSWTRQLLTCRGWIQWWQSRTVSTFIINLALLISEQRLCVVNAAPCEITNVMVARVLLKCFGWLLVGQHDMSHAIFNARLVPKAGPVISSNFHHVISHGVAFTTQSRCSLTSCANLAW